MTTTSLNDRSVYEDRYDKITVELCRNRERMMHDLFGERPALDAEGRADSASGYYQYSMFYFQLVESVAGERWQQRGETVRQWMADDETKDRRLAAAQPATIPYCRSCGENMEIHLKTYQHREGKGTKDEEGILFMFDCKPCHTRLAFWQDGTEWKPSPARCEQCGAQVEETDKRRGNTIITTYICAGCGHNHKSTLKLGGKAKAKVDPSFKLDRRRFCFDAATGQKFLTRKAHIERIGEVLEQGRQRLDGSKEPADPLAEAVEQIQRLKVAQVAKLLSGAVAKDGYTNFKLGDPQIGREVAVPFTCLDDNPERESYDSRMGLKKLITAALVDTNWQLMSDGIHDRLGCLSGRIRAYESDEDLRKLVEKQIKAGTRIPAATAPAPVPERAPAEPLPSPKRTRRRKQRNIRVRGELHHNLLILIPPREGKTSTSNASQKRKHN
jgi:hypothetical protein